MVSGLIESVVSQNDRPREADPPGSRSGRADHILPGRRRKDKRGPLSSHHNCSAEGRTKRTITKERVVVVDIRRPSRSAVQQESLVEFRGVLEVGLEIGAAVDVILQLLDALVQISLSGRFDGLNRSNRRAMFGEETVLPGRKSEIDALGRLEDRETIAIGAVRRMFGHSPGKARSEEDQSNKGEGKKEIHSERMNCVKVGRTLCSRPLPPDVRLDCPRAFSFITSLEQKTCKETFVLLVDAQICVISLLELSRILRAGKNELHESYAMVSPNAQLLLKD
eukprot:scaffold5182_cov49-Attheya_sp.AAC.2